MTKNSYHSALAQARRHIEDACYGRPCLNDCLSRLGGTPPPCACAGGRGAPRRGKLLVLLAVLATSLLFAFLAWSDVQCVWDGDTYQCSGMGSRVEVIGGGTSGEPVVVTNYWGVCTNCVSMSPDQCANLKSGLLEDISYMSGDLGSAKLGIDTSIADFESLQDEISTFRRFGDMPEASIPYSQLASFLYSFTNYVYTVENVQTALDREHVPSTLGTVPAARWVSYNNAIYDYGGYFYSVLDNVKSNLATSRDDVESVIYSLGHLSSSVESIDCTQCQPEYEPGGYPGGSGGGSGGGVVTNVVANGNWCTYDQGEALKTLLGDLKTWAQRQHSQLVSISNYVKQTWQTLRSGLYSDYTALPRGEDWQTLYLEGQPTGWGYDPTNILQRIEVLLYGISGISTNVEERLEDTTPDSQDAIDDINNAVSTISTDASDTDARSLGSAIVRLFGAFTPETKDYSGGEEILAEIQYSVGNESFYVPSVRLGSSGFLVGTMATVKSFVSGFCSVLFLVGGAFAIFRFWVFFSAWCIKLSKWAVELTTSLFAS